MSAQRGIEGKILITAEIVVKTGMHIGGSSEFSAIGAVDNVIIRDPLTQRPIIPGSSLKGKLRTLLARSTAAGGFVKDIKEDSDIIKRMFGSHAPIMPARLQFYDVFMNEDSVQRIEKMNTDLYLSEIKFENTINRTTCMANPRQIERVPAGSIFDFKLVYNVENAAELAEDMGKLAETFKLLSYDYLGGHGSRGYGRVEFNNFQVEVFTGSDTLEVDEEKIAKRLNNIKGI